MSDEAPSSAATPNSQGPAQPGPDWDAATYDRVSDPQAGWASELIGRLAPGPGETVLDAGCGSGRVTAMLADAVDAPARGRVVGVDAAPSMVAHARTALGDRAEILEQSLTELTLSEPVDAVFSNATFHWIADHDALFARLFAALKPGGRLVAQCGGRGNIDAFRRTADAVAAEPPFAPLFEEWVGPWNYPGPEETAARLERAGFTEVDTWLERKDVYLVDPGPFVTTVCLVRHLDRIPESDRPAFVERVLARAGVPLTLAYVRLNMTARRSDG